MGTTTSALTQAGKIRVLSVSSSKRSATLPDVPMGAEAGFPACQSFRRPS
ncbi:MAG: tripartite tricarboxylate transporter substrate-binding protein [candidate division NC10 bacterium]